MATRRHPTARQHPRVWPLAIGCFLALLSLGASPPPQSARPAGVQSGDIVDARLLADLDMFRDLDVLRQLPTLRQLDGPPPSDARPASEEKGKR